MIAIKIGDTPKVHIIAKKMISVIVIYIFAVRIKQFLVLADIVFEDDILFIIQFILLNRSAIAEYLLILVDALIFIGELSIFNVEIKIIEKSYIRILVFFWKCFFTYPICSFFHLLLILKKIILTNGCIHILLFAADGWTTALYTNRNFGSFVLAF